MGKLSEYISDVSVDTSSESVLDLILKHSQIVREPEQAAQATSMIEEFIEEVPQHVLRKSESAAEMINERIAAIDRLLSAQVNEILHHPAFQQLEATWRGLDNLLKSSSAAKDVTIKLLPASRSELLKDFDRAPGFDQSALFKLIYEEEFGTLGGTPFGALVSDLSFGRGAQDVRLLEELSHVAASAHAPLIAAASPHLFDLPSFTELSAPRDLGKIFESGELAGWRAFRDSEDSRYVALALPRTLMRLPYGKDTNPVDSFSFEEDCDGSSHGNYLWGSAAWAMSQRIIASYAEYGWCAAIRGVEGGGVVSGLPLHNHESLSGDIVTKCPTETSITDRREKELSDLGFLPLCYAKGTNYGVFFGAQTTNKPSVYTNELATANSRMASMLPYILAASRFAHYMKAIMRDKIGSFQSKAGVESFLNQWVTRYVTTDDEASQDVKARYPLREARVEVFETAGTPGAYSAVLHLRPHFQLEELTASIRLVAELPQGGA